MKKTTMIKIKSKIALGSIACSSLLLTGCVGDGANFNAPSLIQMLKSIAATFPALIGLLMTICYLAGTFFAAKSLYDIYHVARMSGSMMGAQGDIKPPLLMMIFAGFFLYMPTLLSSFSLSLLGTVGPSGSQMLSYPGAGSFQAGSLLGLQDCIFLVQFIGWCAFVRGWLLLARFGSRNAQVQPGTFGKATTHIIGGVLAANIMTTWSILMATLGMN